MRTAALSLVILCGVLCTHRLFSQDVPFSIRVDVPLVSVDFTVTDSMGKPITDLNRYDFDVFDNGELRPIQNFSPVKSPYNMVLLLDCSESTRDRKLLLLPAMARFVDQLRPQDKAVIAVFGTSVEVVVDLNGAQKGINTADSPMCHGTSFYKAMEWAQKKLQGVSGRHGVVVFTDGRDSDVARKEVLVDGNKVRRVVPPGEDREFQNVLKSAMASGTPFYFVAVDTDLNPGPDYGGPVPDLEQFRARMQQMADSTGGRVAFPKTTAEVVPFFLEISRELGVSYSLGFAPSKSKDKTPHKIEVRVRGEEGYRVHQSRESYPPN